MDMNPNRTRSCSSSCVVDALAKVLGAFLGNERTICHDNDSPKADVRILSYQSDFEYIWGTANNTTNDCPNLFDENHQSTHIIIVWDGIPDASGSSMVNLADYLTPVDWAVWYSLTLGAQNKPCPAISIVDTSARGHAQADSIQLLSQSQNQRLTCMPGIRLFQAISNSNDRQSSSGFLAAIVSDTIGKQCPSPTISNAKMVRKLWRALFLTPTEPSDHHAIANVIGPSLILRDSTDDPLHIALKKLLQQLELIPASSSSSGQRLERQGKPWINWQSEEWAESIKRIRQIDKRTLNMLLVDDVAIQHRWGEVISLALGLTCRMPEKNKTMPQLIADGSLGQLNARLFATESANGFLQSLGLDSEDSKSPVRPDKYRLGCFCDGKTSFRLPIDLIFLDLRLFQGKGLLHEARFFRKIINHIERIRGTSTCVWQEFDETEITNIGDWIDDVEACKPKSIEDTEYLQALTLLPRLIAHYDLSIPIIFFSSTSRRTITEKLKPYGNIITSLEKPRLQLGQDLDIADCLADRFRMALASALEFIAARHLCRTLVTQKTEVTILWDKLKYSPESQEQSKESRKGIWRVQIMLDESGTSQNNQDMTVGGFLAIYPPKADPKWLSECLDRLFPEIKEDKDKTRKNLEGILNSTADLCAQHDIRVVPISLTGNKNEAAFDDPHKSDELHDERVGDNLHRQLVRCTIEFGIYCVARQILPPDVDVEFSVMAPTRVQPLPFKEQQNNRRAQLDKSTLAALEERWGITPSYVGRYRNLWIAKSELKYIKERKRSLYPPQVLKAIELFCETIHDEPPGIGRPKRMIQYFNWSDARPLVEEVMRDYHNSDFEPRADIARAFSINRGHAGEVKRIHALHFLADAFLSSRAKGKTIQRMKNYTISDRYNKKFVKMLESHRLAVQSLLPNSIAHIAATLSKKMNAGIARTLILEELQRAAQDLTGPQFLELPVLLHNALKKAVAPHTIHYGQIVAKSLTGLRIKEGDERHEVTKKDCKDFDNIPLDATVEFYLDRSSTPGSMVAKKVKVTDAHTQA